MADTALEFRQSSIKLMFITATHLVFLNLFMPILSFGKITTVGKLSFLGQDTALAKHTTKHTDNYQTHEHYSSFLKIHMVYDKYG